MTTTLYRTSNLTIGDGFAKNPNRYYLEDFFKQLPHLAGYTSVTQATNMTTAVTSNSKVTLITTASTSSNVTAKEWIEFTFTNSMITANSIVNIVCQDSADNTAGNEKLVFQINDVAAGSCEIRCLNAHDDTAATAQVYKLAVIVDPHILGNQDFCIEGTNAVETSVAFSSTEAGFVLTTAGADDDQVMISPRTTTVSEMGSDSSPSAWSGVLWGTENQVEWTCALRTTSAITTQSFWAGLKLTNTGVYATDANQAYFLYASDDDQGALTTNGDLHFVYSVANTDYVTDLGIAVAASTIYKLRIVVDSDRKVTVYVNETQYGLVTSATAGGATQSTTTQKSNAMTNDIDLIPFVGLQSHSAAADTITLCYEKISRVLFE